MKKKLTTARLQSLIASARFDAIRFNLPQTIVETDDPDMQFIHLANNDPCGRIFAYYRPESPYKIIREICTAMPIASPMDWLNW